MDQIAYLLKNGEVFRENRVSSEDLYIQENRIVDKDEIDSSKVNLREIDLKGLTICPGFIDSQVHFREPGMTHKEDLASGARSALLGGITGFFEMPNTVPATTSAVDLKDKLSRAESAAWTNYAFFMGACKENSDRIGDLEVLDGCCGVKIFMGSSTGSLLVEEEEYLDKIVGRLKRRFSVHSESEVLLRAKRKEILESKNDVSVLLHPVWRDVEVAMTSTRTIVGLAKKYKAKLHLLHVSTQEEMEFLANNKTSEMSVEVTPQHLTLSSPDCYERFGSFAQMNPPIREKRHQDALWKAIDLGIVDIIGSDHAPHTKEEKSKAYPGSPSGIPGVQTMLPLLLNHVATGKLALPKLVDLLCLNPSRLFQIHDRGELRKRRIADLTILDLKKKETIKTNQLVSRAGWSPFEGFEITGWPVMTFIQGQLSARDGEILGKPAGKAYEFQG